MTPEDLAADIHAALVALCRAGTPPSYWLRPGRRAADPEWILRILDVRAVPAATGLSKTVQTSAIPVVSGPPTVPSSAILGDPTTVARQIAASLACRPGVRRAQTCEDRVGIGVEPTLAAAAIDVVLARPAVAGCFETMPDAPGSAAFVDVQRAHARVAALLRYAERLDPQVPSERARAGSLTGASEVSWALQARTRSAEPMSSVGRREGTDLNAPLTGARPATWRLADPSERRLMAHLADSARFLPQGDSAIRSATAGPGGRAGDSGTRHPSAHRRDRARQTHLRRLAAATHTWLDTCPTRPYGDAPVTQVLRARWWLARGAARALRDGLHTESVPAPDRF